MSGHHRLVTIIKPKAASVNTWQRWKRQHTSATTTALSICDRGVFYQGYETIQVLTCPTLIEIQRMKQEVWERKHFKAAATLKRLFLIKTESVRFSEQTGSNAKLLLSEAQSNQENKNETFPFSHLLNDRFPTPQAKTRVP